MSAGGMPVSTGDLGVVAPPVRRPAVGLAVLGAGVVAALVAELAIGPVRIPLGDVWAGLTGAPAALEGSATILRELRLPRAATAAVAGAALGTAGLLMQTVLRNPLADPWLMGITGGARLGVGVLVLVITLLVMTTGSAGALAGTTYAALAAVTGAALALAALAAAARRVGAVTLLIFGLMFDYIATGLLSVLVHFASESQVQLFASWDDGKFGAATPGDVVLLAVAAAVGVGAAAALAKSLNVTLLGDRYAGSLGVPVRRTRLAALGVTALLAGMVTAFCGPVAFIGIATPHLARAAFRTADHRVLIPAVVLLGALVAQVSDLVANLPWPRHFLHLNAVTSLLGAPVVIWVVARDRRRARDA